MGFTEQEEQTIAKLIRDSRAISEWAVQTCRGCQSFLENSSVCKAGVTLHKGGYRATPCRYRNTDPGGPERS